MYLQNIGYFPGAFGKGGENNGRLSAEAAGHFVRRRGRILADPDHCGAPEGGGRAHPGRFESVSV